MHRHIDIGTDAQRQTKIFKHRHRLRCTNTYILLHLWSYLSFNDTLLFAYGRLVLTLAHHHYTFDHTCCLVHVLLPTYIIIIIIITPWIIPIVLSMRSSLQIPSGGWVPLVIAFITICVMYVWWAGSYEKRNVLLLTTKKLSNPSSG